MGVSWSILVEFRFYFILPLVAFLYAVVFKNNIYYSILTTILLILVSQLIWPKDGVPLYSTILGNYIGIFFLGCGVAVLHHHAKSSEIMKSKRICLAIDGLAMLAVSGLIYLIPSVTSFFTGQNIPLYYYHDQYLLFGALWSVVLFACLNGAGLFRTFFELSVLRYIGFISFSLYFFHTTSVALIKYFAPQMPLAAWAMLLFGIGISHITWRYIEKPSSKIRFPGKPS